MEKKKYKPNLKDTARRARIIAHLKEFVDAENAANKERIEKGTDEPITIPITPDGKFREDSHNHSQWGGLDVGISHLPDKIQEAFVSFMVDKGHRVYDERDDISKDPEKQKLGLRAGIVHIDDNVTEENVDPAKNYVKEKGPGVHKMQEELYAEEFGDGGTRRHGDSQNPSVSRSQGGHPGTGGRYGSYSEFKNFKASQNQGSRSGGDRSRGGGGHSTYQTPDWAKKFQDAEAKRKKAEEEMKAFKEKVGDYETKYKRLDELESVPFAEQRSQMVRLAAQAKGLAPSQAEKSMRQSEERQLQQMIGATKMGRGGGAAKMRGLRRMAEGAAGRTAQMGALMRMREKAMAEQALGGSVSEMTGQALKDRWTKMGLDVNKEIAKIQAEAAKYGANLQAQAARRQAQGSMIGGLLGGLGTIAGMAMFPSDKNLKKNIKREDLYKNEYGDSYPGYEDEKGDSKIHKPVNVTPQDLLKKKTKRKKAVKYEKGEPKDFSPQKFLDALKPNSFEYKDEFKKNPLAGEGRFLGIMAQDLEKAGPVGKSMVEDTPMGKLVNYGKGFGAVLAAQAHLNQRLKALESKKKKRK